MAVEQTLTAQTKTTLGVIVSAVVVTAMAFGYLESRFDSLDRRLERIENQAAERWTRSEMRLWVSRFARANPDLSIPEPK